MNTYQQNLEILQRRDPQLASRLRDVEGGVLSLQTAKSGDPTALVQGKYLHSTYNPVREAECWADEQAKEFQENEIGVVLGVGLLYHVQALRKKLSKETPLFVVIPDLRELVDCLTVRGLEGWGEDLKWAWGSIEDMVSPVLGSGKRVRMMNYEPAAAFHVEQYEQFRLHLREHMTKQLKGSLHIMVVGPVYGGSLPIAGYMVRALEALGHRVSWVDHSLHDPGYQQLNSIRDDRLRLTVQQRFSETLGVITLAHVAEDPPDVVLAMSQAPLSMAILEQMRRKKILTAMWFVENFRHLRYWQQMIAGYDFWFVMQKEPCLEAFKQAGARQVSYLPLAADPTIHYPLRLSPEEQHEFGSEVSFLGAGYWNRRQLLPSVLGQGWSFKLWGNEWENAGPLRTVLQRGGARIDTATSMKIFNATSVNINLHSYTREGFDPDGDSVNPRTFELASCGAFQVIDQRTLLPELFDESMMAVMRNPEDLVPTIGQFMNEPEQRREMAEQSKQRVLAEHTYVHRMKTLLSELGMQSPDRLGAILKGERQKESLVAKSQECPEFLPLLEPFSKSERVELVDVANAIRAKGPEGKLTREELLVLMMDEYRQETRDFI